MDAVHGGVDLVPPPLHGGEGPVPQLREAIESQARLIRALARTREGIARQRDALRFGLDAIEAALARDPDEVRGIINYLRWEQGRIAEDHAG